MSFSKFIERGRIDEMFSDLPEWLIDALFEERVYPVHDEETGQLVWYVRGRYYREEAHGDDWIVLRMDKSLCVVPWSHSPDESDLIAEPEATTERINYVLRRLTGPRLVQK